MKNLKKCIYDDVENKTLDLKFWDATLFIAGAEELSYCAMQVRGGALPTWGKGGNTGSGKSTIQAMVQRWVEA